MSETGNPEEAPPLFENCADLAAHSALARRLKPDELPRRPRRFRLHIDIGGGYSDTRTIFSLVENDNGDFYGVVLNGRPGQAGFIDKEYAGRIDVERARPLIAELMNHAIPAGGVEYPKVCDGTTDIITLHHDGRRERFEWYHSAPPAWDRFEERIFGIGELIRDSVCGDDEDFAGWFEDEDISPDDDQIEITPLGNEEEDKRRAEKNALIDRFKGALLGLAVGDALGAALEFKAPGNFEPIADIMGGGPHGLEPGEWTDDTSMAMCLAESLIECGGFNPMDQLDRYVRWWKEGRWSCKGYCFDIGNTTRASLEDYLATGLSYPGPVAPDTAGNGSLMRLAPIPLFFHSQPAVARTAARESSRVTHGAHEAVYACEFFAVLILGALSGETKRNLLSRDFTMERGKWNSRMLARGVERIAEGSYIHRKPPDIRSTGYVLDTLEAALWAFFKGKDFREGALLAVNLGDDADTVGAVYGQLAGAYYGAAGIPPEWLAKLAMRVKIEEVAERLFKASADPLERFFREA